MLLTAASLLGLGDAVRKVSPQFRSWALLVPPLRSRLATHAVRAATRVAAQAARSCRDQLDRADDRSARSAAPV